MKEMKELSLLIDNRNRLDIDRDWEEYQELTEEIQLLQNDLVTLSIMGEDLNE
jgi:hypothetical protein